MSGEARRPNVVVVLLDDVGFGAAGTFGGPAPDDAHLSGVILRLNPDGSAPADNPFFAAGAAIGWNVPHVALRVALPAGISFYTFQSMSYTIDVYRGHAPARTRVVAGTRVGVGMRVPVVRRRR